MKTSESLEVGSVYTRAQLQEKFDIVDATIRTGIFRPKGHDSIWLFITLNKSADRVQYIDSLVGDVLLWEGQTGGRKDKSIVEHQINGLELIVFFRHDRNQFLGAGFLYEGPFTYKSHSGSHPASFVLSRD